MLRRIATIGVMSILLVLAACRAASGGGQGLQLDGTWQLTSGTSGGTAIPLVAGRGVTLVIAGDTVSGQVCNQYSGTIAVSGTRVTFSNISMTEMACDGPLMTEEAAYHAALASVETATRNGSVLVLSGPKVELRFERTAQLPDAPLVGTTWQLETLVSGETASSAVGAPATLVLGQDGTLTGSTGCRDFTASYAIAGARVTVGDIQVDARLCTTELAAQDEHVLGVLAGPFQAAVSGQALTLTAADGSGLGYRVGSVPGSPAPVASAIATPPVPSATPRA
jgi:heat shock protein HslJ